MSFYWGRQKITTEYRDSNSYIEESYGKETAQAIKDSLKEKYGTFEITYDDCLKLASDGSSEIKQCEADLNKESGKIAEDRKNAILKAEEQLAADINV